jgi:hypothetical protein
VYHVHLILAQVLRKFLGHIYTSGTAYESLMAWLEHLAYYSATGDHIVTHTSNVANGHEEL